MTTTRAHNGRTVFWCAKRRVQLTFALVALSLVFLAFVAAGSVTWAFSVGYTIGVVTLSAALFAARAYDAD